MHAYLIVTNSEHVLDQEVGKIISKTKCRLLEFRLQKIEDSRELKSYLNFTATVKTAILLKNIDTATDESINAILKCIEEPQDDVIFILHASNEENVIPTIRSRCTIVRKAVQSGNGNTETAGNFMKMDPAQQMAYIAKTKERDDVKSFCRDLIQYNLASLTDGRGGKEELLLKSKNLKHSLDFYRSLILNGNITLQALRFVSLISDRETSD